MRASPWSKPACVRQKNAVNILAKNLFVFALAVTAYWFVGYSFMYGDAAIDGWLYFAGFFFDPAVTAETISEAGLVPTVDFLFPSRICWYSRHDRFWPR
jgi:Amt family ammonium transporter